MRNSSRGAVDPFIVMDFMAAAARAEANGKHIIHMEVGQPGTGAPSGATDALTKAMGAGSLGYTVALGLPALRDRIALLYMDWYGLTIDPARIIITPGASGAFILAYTALFDAGDRIGIGEPCYPSYRQILNALDLQTVGIQTSAENRFQPVPDQIHDLNLAGLMVASPANPSGTMLSHAALEGLVQACQNTSTTFISDEIYHGIEYEAKAVSALQISNDVCVINSFSKYFSMTGWRVGWMVVPEDNLRQVERLAQNMFICAPHASQVAALAAMECNGELQQNLAIYAGNRRLMLEGLPAAGFTKIAPPDGAFYVYADVSAFTDDSLAFAAEILEHAGVAVTPGLDFDPVRGKHMMRFSYAGRTEDIREGLSRLKAFMAAR